MLSSELDFLHAICSDNLGNELWLVDDEASLQFYDTFLASLDSFVQVHVLLKRITEHRVDEVSGIAVSSLRSLLKCAQVVHPVEFGALLIKVVSAHEAVDLEWCSSEGGGHLGAHPLGCRLDIWLVSGPELHKLHVALAIL